MKSIGYRHRRIGAFPRITGLFLSLSLLAQGACTEQSAQETLPQVGQPSETPEQSMPVTGEVPPELLEKIYMALSEEQNLDKSAITVIRAESVIWPDGSLGCAQPGEMYTMATVQGYWVVLQSGKKEFDYRVSATGQFFRCRNLFRIQNPVG